jgi:hypothetical protein
MLLFEIACLDFNSEETSTPKQANIGHNAIRARSIVLVSMPAIVIVAFTNTPISAVSEKGNELRLPCAVEEINSTSGN